jgi:hypothetical protein
MHTAMTGVVATELKEAKMMVKYFHHNSIMQSICTTIIMMEFV